MYRKGLFFLSVMLGVLTISLNGCSSASTAIYVSPDGDDQFPGKRSKPVASLQRAAELARMKPGNKPINIWLSGGIYRLSEPLALGLPDGGTVRAPVTWKAVLGEKPVVSGGVQLDDWKIEEDGAWSAPLPEAVQTTFRSLYVNNRRAIRARLPNRGFLRIEKAGEDDRTNFFFKENDLPEIAAVNNLELILLHDWSMSRVGVKSIDWASRHLYTTDTIGARSPSFFSLTNWEKQPRYFLENALEFLDAPGEWYCDFSKQRIYYRPQPGEKIDELEAVIPLASKLITIKGDKTQQQHTGFITFEGITFEHTAWPLPSEGYCGIQACMFDNRRQIGDGWDKVPAAIELDLAEHCVFKDCIIRHTGGSGIWIRENCKSCELDGSHVYDISGNGINIGEGRDRLVDEVPWWKSVPEQVCADTKITHCLIEECGKQFYGAVGIWGGLVERTLIDHNEIRDLPYTGVSVGWMWDTIPTPCRENVISNNHIHHILNILSDGGGIYNLGLQPGSRIIGNLIHDVSVNAGRAESNGMFLDEGIKDVLVEDNIIYNIARSPLRFHRASLNVVRNNVFVCGEGIPPIRYNRTNEKDIQKYDNLVLKDSISSDMDRLRAVIEERMKDIGPRKKVK